ncbi:MAG: PAP/fibrillin family protein [Caulobacterales bacterium]|nr:PAP/fibrillin family protein [Caulobacterales bacterium]
MTDIAALKTDLLAAIGLAGDDGTYSDEAYERVHAAIDALTPNSPMPRPVDVQDEITAPWGTLFAQFGVRHTAGKPVKHQNFFHFMTWGALPKLPFMMEDIVQEIHHETNSYNNVHLITSEDGDVPATMIIFGRYSVGGDQPQRYVVDFHRCEIRARNGGSDEDIRAAFGFEAGQPLSFDLKAPPLHSDIVYCDEEIRINKGSLGGVYVMNRMAGPGVSVRFA